MLSSITLTVDPALQLLIEECIKTQVQTYISQFPQPAWQLSCTEVAFVLSLDVETIRTYLSLPLEHERHLPHVKTSDSARGNRILLDEVKNWQYRNNASRLQETARIAFEKSTSLFNKRRGGVAPKNSSKKRAS